MMDCDDLTGILEGILFGAGEAIGLNDLCQCLDKTASEIRFSLKILSQDYQSKARGIRLIQIKDTYQLSTKPEYYDYIKEITMHKQKTGLSRAALETLAIVAYQQPVTRITVDEIRGVSSSSAIQRLLDRGLICDGGRLEAPGRPILYKTTLEFLKAVGFVNLNEMPEYEVFSQGIQEMFELNTSERIKEKPESSPEALFSSVLEQAIAEEKE
ncbi:MAG: SMC-Scp complex subunit ScpB [Acetobacterium sp.]